MKKLITIIIAVCAAWSAAWAAQQNRYEVRGAETGPQCMGWGVDLAEWAEQAGALDDWYLPDFVNEVVGTMGARVFRYGFPGTGTDVYHGADGQTFMDEDGSYHWERDGARQRLLQRLHERCWEGDFLAVGAVPDYMKVRAVDGTMVLNPIKYIAYANYLVEVLNHFKTEYELEFRSIDPGVQDADFLTVLDDKLKSANLTTVLAGNDTMKLKVGEKASGTDLAADIAAMQAMIADVRGGESAVWMAPEVPATYNDTDGFKLSKLFHFYRQVMAPIWVGSRYVNVLNDNALASLNEDGSALTLLLLNPGENAVREWIDLRGLEPAADHATASRTSATEDGTTVEAPVVNGGYLMAELPAQSLTAVLLPVKPIADQAPSAENLLSFGLRDAVIVSRTDKRAEHEIILNAITSAPVTLKLEGDDAKYFAVEPTKLTAPGSARITYTPEARGCHHVWLTATADDGVTPAARVDIHGDAYDAPALSLTGNTAFKAGGTEPDTTTLSLKATGLTGEIVAEVDGADAQLFTSQFPWAVKQYTQIVFDNSRTGWKHVKAYLFNPDHPVSNLICGCQGRGYPMVDAGNGLFTQQYPLYFEGLKIKFMEDMETTVTEAIDFLPGVIYYASGRCADRYPHTVPLMMDVDDTLDVAYTPGGEESASAVLRLSTRGLDTPLTTNLIAHNAGAPAASAERNSLFIRQQGRIITVQGDAVTALSLLTLTGTTAASINAASLDASALPAGVYLLRIATADGAESVRRLLLR